MLVTFLSDYGLADEFVGVVHGVLARLAPAARVLDLGHGVPPQDVRAGARMLARALPYVPAGVHLAVVDPGVGSARRAVALRAAREDRLLVGPDNGLLIPAAERFGGVVEAVEVSATPWRLEPVAATFHGRDVFAPAAAWLACGRALGAAGAALDPASLVRLEAVAAARRLGAGLAVAVLGSDGFGNVALAVTADELAAVGIRPGGSVSVAGRPARYGRTFADAVAGGLVLYEDAGGDLALAVNGGSAAEVLGVGAGDEVVLVGGG